MRTLSLTRTASVKLSGAGAGTAQLGPSSPGEVWLPAIVSVGVATNTDEATCKIYVGPVVSQPYFTDGTFSGSSGDSTDRVTGKSVYPGQYIFAAWTGGDANALATMNITGTRQVP